MLIFNVNNQCKSKEYNKNVSKLFTLAAKEICKELNIKKELFFDVNFFDIDQIHELNLKYRKIDKPTDVITFAFWDVKDSIKTPLLGEIFLCVDIIKQKAIEQENDLITQIVFTFIHGVLHLLGYDHMIQKDEEIMFELQDKILMKVIKYEN